MSERKTKPTEAWERSLWSTDPADTDFLGRTVHRLIDDIADRDATIAALREQLATAERKLSSYAGDLVGQAAATSAAKLERAELERLARELCVAIEPWLSTQHASSPARITHRALAAALPAEKGREA
jgi:hypothetical protein